MNVTRFWPAVLVGLCLSCSSSKKPESTPGDGGLTEPDASDAALEDTSIASGPDGAFPMLKDGGFPLDDGTTSCDQLLSMVTMLQATAQACTPGEAASAKGKHRERVAPSRSTRAPDPGAVADYEEAVMAYVMMCNPKCLLPNCPPIQGACSGAGTCQ